MTTVTEVSYSVAAIEDAHDALVALIDAGASNGNIKIYDSADVLLATIPLDDPCGTVSAVTGLLTLAIDGDETDATAGTAEYGTISDSDGTVHITMPVTTGSSASPGYLVINSLTILDGATVTVASATVG
jgi:hypothetical protein